MGKCLNTSYFWLISSLTSLVYSPLFLYDWATTERLRNPPESEEEDEVDEGWNYWDNPPVENSSLTQNIEQFVWRGTCTGRQEESSLNYWSLQQFLRESCRVWAWRDVERRRWWSAAQSTRNTRGQYCPLGSKLPPQYPPRRFPTMAPMIYD